MLEGLSIFSIFNSKKINRIFIIYYIFFLLPIFCTIVIPIKYVEDYSQSVNTPKEIMTYYMKQKINIKLEIGTPKQEIEIPLGFDVSDFYIVDKTHLRTSTIKNKLFDDKKSSSFNIISGDSIEYYYNDDYSTYQDGYDTLYFLKEYGKSDYGNIKMDFRFAYLTSTDDPGRFGLQIYSKDEDDRKVPCPLRMLYQNKMNANYVWSIHFNKRENTLGDEGYLIIGEYPHEFKKNIGIYDTYNFNKENFVTIFDISNSKTMNYEFQMSSILFYDKEGYKDATNQKKFNDLKSEDLLKDIIIPQVTLSYVTHFDFNFGGILIPEYFNAYIKRVAFDPYIKEGKCFIEYTFNTVNVNFYYCKKEKSVINKIKNKIPTVIFCQEHLRYNFTIGINDLIYEKNDYVFFLLFSSGNQKNKWTLGKPFLQKYPLVFNPEAKDIGFYSSFLLTGIKTGIVVVIAILISLAFIVIGLLIGRKKYKQYKIQKQKALELSSDSFLSNYKSIELNSNGEENKLYKD
jgi:hypothetical protein